MRTDPTDNGGLFVGRRPGHARRSSTATRPSAARAGASASTGCSRAALLALMVLRQPAVLGADPAGCAVDRLARRSTATDSVDPGHPRRRSSALLAALFGGLIVLKRLDHTWILVRRAAGHDQREGVDRPRLRRLARRSARSLFIGLADHHRRARARSLAPGAVAPMGFLDYYRQFEGMTDEEVSARAARAGAPSAAARRSRASSRSTCRSTTWPEYPHPDVVNAITYAARRGLHRYLDRARRRAALRARRTATASRASASSSATAPRSCSARPPRRYATRRRARHAVAVLPALSR